MGNIFDFRRNCLISGIRLFRDRSGDTKLPNLGEKFKLFVSFYFSAGQIYLLSMGHLISKSHCLAMLELWKSEVFRKKNSQKIWQDFVNQENWDSGTKAQNASMCFSQFIYKISCVFSFH